MRHWFSVTLEVLLDISIVHYYVMSLSSPSSGLIVASALIDISQQKPTDYKDKSQALKNRKALPPAHQGTCVWVSIHPLDPFLYHLRSGCSTRFAGSSSRPLQRHGHVCKISFSCYQSSFHRNLPQERPLSVTFFVHSLHSAKNQRLVRQLELLLPSLEPFSSICWTWIWVPTVKHAKLVELPDHQLKVTLETENLGESVTVDWWAKCLHII